MLKHTSRLISTPRKFKLINPKREWVIGISVATLMFVGGGIYTGTLFLEESERDYLNTTVTNIDVVSYKYDLVRDVLDTYASKQKQFNDLRQNYTAPVLPQSVSTTTKTDETVAQ